MDMEASKQALREQFEPIVTAMGFKFSPDKEIVEFLLEQEVNLHAQHGIPFCPCKGLTGDRTEDMGKVCPCIPWHRAHFDRMKRCWCGLYVHLDVDDPDKLPQIPEELG
ncbi:MAG: Ferredoxin thioredoxin reductase catalytic beta chain [Methanomassiliicoccales archaeon PtaU1.Bin124]|nr:MAG: Ferredoxin thioredoxin reductase catalytic beta chain [Methanomassiliicoccales archaeon PtaU1.Bin124]